MRSPLCITFWSVKYTFKYHVNEDILFYIKVANFCYITYFVLNLIPIWLQSRSDHFADDTNLFHRNKSVKNLTKLVNRDMNYLNNWLSANTSINVEKTELVIFKSTRKILFVKIKIKLSGKRLYPSTSVKYLAVRIDIYLHWYDK